MDNTEAVSMFLLVANLPILLALIAYFIYGSVVYRVLFVPDLGSIFISICVMFWFIAYYFYGKYLNNTELLILT